MRKFSKGAKAFIFFLIMGLVATLYALVQAL